MPLTLIVSTRAKTIAMPFLEKYSNTPFEDSPHFFEFDEVLKGKEKC